MLTLSESYSSVQKPIIPTELYRGVRDSQLIGLSGYSREVFILILFVMFTVSSLDLKMFIISILQYLAPLRGRMEGLNNDNCVS